MRISDWSSDVCSSDLQFEQVRIPAWRAVVENLRVEPQLAFVGAEADRTAEDLVVLGLRCALTAVQGDPLRHEAAFSHAFQKLHQFKDDADLGVTQLRRLCRRALDRSEEHTSELQSLMRISYAVFCLKKKKRRELTS